MKLKNVLIEVFTGGKIAQTVQNLCKIYHFVQKPKKKNVVCSWYNNV